MYVLYGVLEYTQTSQIYKKDYQYDNKQYCISLNNQSRKHVVYRIKGSFFLSLFIQPVGLRFLQFFLY
jgi:hypothetical protein